MSKPTLGQTVIDKYSTQQDEIELGDLKKDEMERYFNYLTMAMDTGKKMFNGNFFIEVAKKRERLMPQILPRIFALPRSTCPTPFYDQDVYIYNREDDCLDFVWAVPDPDTCDQLANNMNNLCLEDKELLEFVFKYKDGSLLRMARKFNGEKEDQINPIILLE